MWSACFQVLPFLHSIDRNEYCDKLIYYPPLLLLWYLFYFSEGLAELHAIGVVHGDIKPGNVLLSGDNPAKIRLSDFGLSQWRAAGLGHTLGQSSLHMTAHFRGTSIYAPPEMLRRFIEDSESDEEDTAKSSRLACGKVHFFLRLHYLLFFSYVGF